MLTDFIISRIRAELPFEPNAEKEGLLQALGTFIVSRDARKAFILRGYAGTGKTSVMSALVRALDGLKQPCVLLAPTGRAAKRLSEVTGMEARTIHRLLGETQGNEGCDGRLGRSGCKPSTSSFRR